MSKKTDKPKMGRPPLPPRERKTRRVGVNLTVAEFRALEREARQAGVPMGVLMADCWREHRERKG